jgi:hypothetical protein
MLAKIIIKMRIMQTSLGNFATKIIILSFGLLFLLPSAYKLYAYCAFRLHAVSVNGTIIDSSRGKDLGSRPFIEYKDLLGNSYERKSKVKTHWFFAAKVGEKIKVFYDRHDPTVAIVDSAFHYIILPLTFIAIGICFLFCFVRDILNEKQH